MDYLIRKATNKDAQKIADFIRPIVKQFVSFEFTDQGEKIMLDSMSASVIEDNIKTDYQYTVSIKRDNQIIGVLGMRSSSHLFHLFVAPSRHGEGIGRALWEDCLKHSNINQFTVNSSALAVGFYEKLGFIKQGDKIEKNGVIFYPMMLSLNNDS